VDGCVIVDKPAGPTSHDVVARLRRAYRQRRVGHAGTLDPPATGVLVCALGRAARLLRFVQAGTKVYRAEVVFGVATDTGDATGRERARVPVRVDAAALEAVLPSFTGEIWQTPPMVSAVQVGGRRLHELARAGLEVDRPPRRVRIERIELLEVRNEPPTAGGPSARAWIRVTCGAGTYIRSLAADLAAALGGVAHLGSLRRERVGPFTLADAREPAEIERDPAAAVLPPAAAVAELPALVVPAPVATRVAHGAPLPAPGEAEGVLAGATGPEVAEGGHVAVFAPHGALLGVYVRRAAGLRPEVVLAAPAAA
jgi:tRNA pseudouridine55 synthase